MSAPFMLRGPMRVEWNGARIAQLCEKYGDGKTFAQIAPKLGCTRSAAIGRFNRLREQADIALCGRHDELVRLLERDAHGGRLDRIATHMRIPVEAVELRFAEMRRALGKQAI